MISVHRGSECVADSSGSDCDAVIPIGHNTAGESGKAKDRPVRARIVTQGHRLLWKSRLVGQVRHHYVLNTEAGRYVGTEGEYDLRRCGLIPEYCVHHCRPGRIKSIAPHIDRIGLAVEA